MKCLLTIAILLCGLPGGVQAMTPGDTALRLREEAAELYARGDTENARDRLDQARDAAQRIGEGYARANALRYVAEAYCHMQLTLPCRETFSDALGAALPIPLWYRRLSAIIGVVELQKSVGDGEGARGNALAAISSGLLEQVAAQGQAGETGRFIAALDRLLSAEELNALRSRIDAVPSPEFRRKALHALNNISSKAAIVTP